MCVSFCVLDDDAHRYRLLTCDLLQVQGAARVSVIDVRDLQSQTSLHYEYMEGMEVRHSRGEVSMADTRAQV